MQHIVSEYEHLTTLYTGVGRKVKVGKPRWNKETVELCMIAFMLKTGRCPTRRDFRKNVITTILDMDYKTACKHLGQTPRQFAQCWASRNNWEIRFDKRIY